MGLFVDTISTNVTIGDLGITLVHPTLNRDLGSQFTAEEIRKSTDLYSAIANGQLNWKLASGGAIQPITNFDPDFFELEQESTGSGYGTSEARVTATETLTLTASSRNRLFFKGTATGQIVRLPNATTCQLGHDIQIFNLSSQPIVIQNQDGTSFATLLSSSNGRFTLQDNLSSNGLWFYIESFSDVASGIVNYNITSSATFSTASATDVTITDFTITPLAGRYAVWYSANCQHTVNNSFIYSSVYVGGTKIADSERVAQTVGSNFFFISATQTVINANGAQAVDVRVRRATSGSVTITGRSLTLIRLGSA